MHKILILGPQGSGKGTQAERLAVKLNIPALSMGSLLREETASGSELGNELKAVIDRGELVSDEDALKILKRRLKKEDAQNGYILDGYPRNFDQYHTYKVYDEPTDVLVIDVPREESMKRIISRAKIEHRSDDTSEAVEKRLRIYEESTQPIIDEYKKSGIVKFIDGVGTRDEIENRIEKALDI
ncbi:nucleoside monophosphate kinase [Patescibacteria group bacterium]|nr:nucleoside monophosphate kinase [Patescibacteria group bacterium]